MTNATVQLLARHVGIWEGDYTHIDPRDRSVQEQQLEYSAVAVGDRLRIDTGRIHGECGRVDHDALYLRFGFHEEKLWRITLVRERRVSLDPFALPLDARFRA